MEEQCIVCAGAGRRGDSPCPRCEGSGKVDFFAWLASHRPDEDPQTICMSYVGQGWWNLLTDMFAQLKAAGWSGRFRQIKEKFGALRIYATECPRDSVFYNIINTAEAQSRTICEQCGAAGTLRSLGGWYHVACDACEAANAAKKEHGDDY